jgi:uncharacterized protein GlcG (DUF336 family)
MSSLSMEQAVATLHHALAFARERSMKPVAVAVVDHAGQLIAFQREDQPSILRSDIAIGKAYTAAAVGLGGRDLVRRATAQPLYYQSLIASSGGRMIIGIGSVLIRDGSGMPVGAIAVSGDDADKDEACAIAATERAGFIADAGRS